MHLRKGAVMGLLASVLALFGCDQQQIDKVQQKARDVLNSVKPDSAMLQGLRPGVSSEDDVRRQMGKPEIVWQNDDGSKRLEYPRGPAGTKTYMADIGENGKLISISQALTAENFARIRVGMTKDDVRRLLGKPATVAAYPLKKEEVWSWRWLEDGVNQPGLFNVHFDPQGTVVTTSRSNDPASERN